jgi:hypothetical protein
MTIRLSGPDLFNMEIGLGDAVELVDLPLSGRVSQDLLHGAIVIPVAFAQNPAIRDAGNGAAMLETTAAYLVESLYIRADDANHPSPDGNLSMCVVGRLYGPWPFHCFYRSVDSWFVYELEPAIFLPRGGIFAANVHLDAPYQRRQFSVMLRGKLARPR